MQRTLIVTVITIIGLSLATMPVKAEFVPDPSNPPKTTFGSGAR